MVNTEFNKKLVFWREKTYFLLILFSNMESPLNNPNMEDFTY